MHALGNLNGCWQPHTPASRGILVLCMEGVSGEIYLSFTVLAPSYKIAIRLISGKVLELLQMTSDSRDLV